MKQNCAKAGRVTGTMAGSLTLFQTLSLDDRKNVAQYLKLRMVRKNSYIVSLAQQTSDVYFLLSGSVNVCAFSQDGKLVHYDRLVPGVMFGEIAAIDEGKRTSNCIAVCDSSVAVISREDFLQIMRDYPSVMEATLRHMATLLRRHMIRVYEYSAYKVPQRIRHELIRLASHAEHSDSPIQILDPPTHAELAARTATHREAVTLELNNLIKHGIISWRPGGDHLIHDISALTEMVEK